ncbi:hypothetical protein FOXG_21366 [Fusarium oxysporum f. sp. lycopersici 4287]|uniref:Uncharacterized protein n=1 Tax=Fusarium oxysporum f. sp. lycopersici (strain 4287 / CBS 123668 / FGSC 9935 / NRRL 34936) TaxID=426428 RepID=A0A0J9VSK4_FUSO4|nr:hypothetical protein FOXG_20942 [Fusarium oxysporum f. sp. lycopersici 4287]XP_018253573.1 hypothetical protein FOXG_21366 [Fusarium oxysporum f. sp. lycopersici 4287]EWZ78199.1 hypothetical protein FOWG_17501 [Fusarium oxysporum f. sp. lycopersici MN25]KAJ9413067.1 hypothetical protein QL093DRAFT_2527417 [Fusarium oxysporum]KNB13833.1 hypothetical protein FOXG_20942 [Fusarium oxysporum f. sp. lycopersici 4287]KNB15528.1 hypothetical protein FOXG_21366 [Fusarium oxysporum f. sp. lycopersici
MCKIFVYTSVYADGQREEDRQYTRCADFRRGFQCRTRSYHEHQEHLNSSSSHCHRRQTDRPYSGLTNDNRWLGIDNSSRGAVYPNHCTTDAHPIDFVRRRNSQSFHQTTRQPKRRLRREAVDKYPCSNHRYNTSDQSEYLYQCPEPDKNAALYKSIRIAQHNAEIARRPKRVWFADGVNIWTFHKGAPPVRLQFKKGHIKRL